MRMTVVSSFASLKSLRFLKGGWLGYIARLDANYRRNADFTYSLASLFPISFHSYSLSFMGPIHEGG